MPNRRTFTAAACAWFPWPADVAAQGTAAPRRVAFLTLFARADAERLLGGIRSELQTLGWVDGRNLVLHEPRTTEGRNEDLPVAAAEVVARNPDLILVQSLPATRAAMQATRSIPIVMAGVGNPVEYGIVADYRRPGGNVTGASFMANEYTSKLLQLLKEAVPRLRSVAFFINPNNEASAPMARQLRADAAGLGMQIQVVEIHGKDDFDAAFAAIRRASSQSVLLPPEPLILSRRDAIASFSMAHGLPLAVVGSSSTLPANGLISYGPVREEYPRLAARYVDRILNGARPGDLPIEQPTRFHLAINLRTASALGLTIAPGLLLRADEVIR